MTQRRRLLYLLNGFDAGGAERAPGLLLAGGAFDGFDVDVVALVRGAGCHMEHLQRMASRVETLLGDRRLRPWHVLAAERALRPRLGGYDAAVLSLPQANLAGRFALARLEQRPLVYSFHHNTHFSNPAYGPMFRATAGLVDGVVADSLGTAEAAAKLYGRQPPAASILPLVQFAERHPQPARPWTPGRPFRLVTAGRLTRVKRQAALIEAVARLQAQGRDVRLTIFGDGPRRAALSQQVARAGVAARVVLSGHSDDWLKSEADAFVLSSRHEGLCIVALEAMHRGWPVIAPAVGELPRHAAAGALHLLPSAGGAAVAKAIADLMDAPQRLYAMRAAGIDYANRQYGATAVRDAYATFNRRLHAELAQRAARQGLA
ncbi:glycosyltransferase [Phenylobacterium sp. J426]|uniref:glycosyltransferase n=1 Tax=Phenylobacterium sp. J426 TaxID=2898439 RepID=UPI0021518BA5|nr:glycosyltransferase [Phenylobacterium sp. J426]MCR5876714.1 glycosyltransferase [Phenylobacterium sp. J426]